MALYEGEIGDAIVKAIQARGGLMTKQDLIGKLNPRGLTEVGL